MVKLRRILAVVLAVLVLFAILASLFFLLHESDHDCAGEDCPVCAALAICRNTLNQLAKALVMLAVAFALTGGIFWTVTAFRHIFKKITPISLNVKLLN